eukprot:335764-Hanusia_phi.AAC.1
MQENPDLEIADTPLRDWIKWDSGCSVAQYASRMAVTGWGGGIEMAACSYLKKVSFLTPPNRPNHPHPPPPLPVLLVSI